MKKLVLIAALTLLALPAVAGEHPLKTPSGWFDMENCVLDRSEM